MTYKIHMQNQIFIYFKYQ